jgi:polyhydroxybutyrate depolymerase
MVYGKQRSIITDIGGKYNLSQPTKLIIAFHGRTNPNTLVRTYYKIEQASQGNAIIVYPLGLPEE